MPVKGQLTKSRTAKSTKKGPKLKWWYILPVIAIVAVAGYAIVRYSNASSAIIRKVGVNILANRIINKSGTNYAVIGNGGYAVAQWSSNEALFGGNNTLCIDGNNKGDKYNAASLEFTVYSGDTDKKYKQYKYIYDGTFRCYNYDRKGKIVVTLTGIPGTNKEVLVSRMFINYISPGL
jgi:hypothetical protein